MSSYVVYKSERIPANIAITASEQQRGLMGVKEPPPATAFVYPDARKNSFWMHNTPAPLDIIFCHEGRITQICKGEPHSTKLIGDDSISDLVIEMPYGSAAKLGMNIGEKIAMELHKDAAVRLLLAGSYRY